jgi:hypothetical protein
MPFLRTCLLDPVERAPGLQVRTREGHRIEAANLGHAIAAAEQLLNIRLVTDGSSKGFDSSEFFRAMGLSEHDGMWVGIEIHHYGKRTYPAHDFNLLLSDDDTVVISAITG